MNTKALSTSPELIFSPFLLFYAAFVLLMHDPILSGDEPHYLQYADNLLNGFYSPADAVDLWYGPGYPLFLMPLVAIGLPKLVITLANAFFHYLSLIFLFKTFLLFTTRKAALFFSVAWGLYYIAYETMPYILTEGLATALVSGFIYATSRSLSGGRIGWVWAAGICLGYLALTKVFFGYVLLTSGLISLVGWLLQRHSALWRRMTLIYSISLLTTLPYLWYTYQLTGHWFYWGNSGGMNLYWMSTPYPEEYGDWNTADFSGYYRTMALGAEASALLRKHHLEDFQEISRFDLITQDALLKEKAVDNIRRHPGKYLKNWAANICRLFFGFPISYLGLKYHYLVRLPAGAILFTLALGCSWPTIRYWRRLPPTLRMILLWIVIYLGGTSLLSAQPRQLSIMVPGLIFWIGIILSTFVRIDRQKRKLDGTGPT